MDKRRAQLKVLLLQIRDESQTRREEVESFARFCRLEPDQFTVLNVFDTPVFDVSVVTGFDALFVGGSSEASVLEPERYPFLAACQRLLRDCIRLKRPVFASCFGHQLAIMALGGRIIHDQRDFEMGTIGVRVTKAGREDILFQDTPDPFQAVSVHRERATALPPGCTLLAYTAACTHAFRVDGAPFWTTQFHPEVSKSILIERLTVFKEKYTDGDDHLQKVLDNAVETPESNRLLEKFVDRVLLGVSPVQA